MLWCDYLSYFFGGVFLSNAIPHFINGVMGHPFQSPFAKPGIELKRHGADLLGLCPFHNDREPSRTCQVVREIIYAFHNSV